ncbi:MAG: hypothetical protein EHM14_05235 [Methanothrix sp.]|nr:MAG: hypothetical protein EHM14_05235 [Methanothrix sp.]
MAPTRAEVPAPASMAGAACLYGTVGQSCEDREPKRWEVAKEKDKLRKSYAYSPGNCPGEINPITPQLIV